MRLSKETTVRVTNTQSNIIGHLGYAAYKLWNTCKYERDHWKELGLTEYPGWYYQKRVHKNDRWFKSLPSQTAQEVCKLLDKSYKSYHALLKTGGVKNPHAPRFKHEPLTVTYMQNGIVHNGNTLRLTLPAQLKTHMAEHYDIHENYLFLENKVFRGMDNIRQVKLYMPEHNVCRVVLVYEVPAPDVLPDNGRYLSIDLGVHNMITAYDSVDGSTFILGRKYSAILHYYDKQIAHFQSISDSQQTARGIKYPKKSVRVQELYAHKRNTVHDLLHKCARYIADYCHSRNINTVVIGDITGIREENDLGSQANQKFHQLPYKQIYGLLEYKLALYGIRLILQREAYSSQTPPSASEVSKQYAYKQNRTHRGLYKDGNTVYNADAVGAYNILRLYKQKSCGQTFEFPTGRLSCPVQVAV